MPEIEPSKLVKAVNNLEKLFGHNPASICDDLSFVPEGVYILYEVTLSLHNPYVRTGRVKVC